MEPLTMAAAAFVGLAAVSGGGSVLAAKANEKQERARINFEAAQAKLAAAFAAESNVKDFRRALASQAAITAARGGRSTSFRQFAGESVSNFLADQSAIKRGVEGVRIRQQIGLGQGRIGTIGTGFQALGQFGQAAFSAANLSGGTTPAKPEAGGAK